MAHNVAEIENEGDTTRMIGGQYSGESLTTLDYRITFNEDETFLYICEPHSTMGMVGKVTVGSGVTAEVEEPDEPYVEENNTPGFTTLAVALALVSAVIIYRRK